MTQNNDKLPPIRTRKEMFECLLELARRGSDGGRIKSTDDVLGAFAGFAIAVALQNGMPPAEIISRLSQGVVGAAKDFGFDCTITLVEEFNMHEEVPPDGTTH